MRGNYGRTLGPFAFFIRFRIPVRRHYTGYLGQNTLCKHTHYTVLGQNTVEHATKAKHHVTRPHCEFSKKSNFGHSLNKGLTIGTAYWLQLFLRILLFHSLSGQTGMVLYNFTQFRSLYNRELCISTSEKSEDILKCESVNN
jgi:hypothetical protein